jgi:hypothetical protein
LIYEERTTICRDSHDSRVNFGFNRAPAAAGPAAQGL